MQLQQPPYKIGIVTKTPSFYKKLDSQRKSNHLFELELIKSLETLQQIETRGKSISTFIFDSTHTAEEIIKLGQYINKSKRLGDAVIFLAFDDFEIFKEVTIHEVFTDAKILNMPMATEDIYHRLITDTQQLKTEDQTEIKLKEKSPKANSASFLNIFIESTKATLEEMATCNILNHSAPEIYNEEKLEEKIVIRGKLAINSEHFNGSFFISFPESTYLKMCSRILYEEVTSITKDNEDLASEICNIVYGKSKVMVGKLNMKLDMVIPTYNRENRISSPNSVLIVKFATDLGPFYIKVAPGLS
jgi:CheY-specific phosphatase CheX